MARSFPPSLTARSVAVKSVTGAPLASKAEKYTVRGTSAPRLACPVAGVASAVNSTENRRKLFIRGPLSETVRVSHTLFDELRPRDYGNVSLEFRVNAPRVRHRSTTTGTRGASGARIWAISTQS